MVMYDIASALVEVSGQVAAATNDGRGLDPNIVRPGYVALGMFLAMAAALALLMWSFARISRRARAPWDGEEPEDAGSEPAGHTDSRR